MVRKEKPPVPAAQQDASLQSGDGPPEHDLASEQAAELDPNRGRITADALAPQDVADRLMLVTKAASLIRAAGFSPEVKERIAEIYDHGVGTNSPLVALFHSTSDRLHQDIVRDIFRHLGWAWKRCDEVAAAVRDSEARTTINIADDGTADQLDRLVTGLQAKQENEAAETEDGRGELQTELQTGTQSDVSSPAPQSDGAKPEAGTPLEPTAVTPPGKEAQAIAHLVEHSDWTNTEIAKQVGVVRQTLYKWPTFMKARAAMKIDPPRGSKSSDGTIEAIDEN